jgi:branched-chain amino acid transport system substrate-binding protein
VGPSVKIGLVAPFEGRYRYIGYDVIYAARLAVREANANGGINGYTIQLVAYDDSGDADTAAGCVRKLGFDPLVVGAVGHFRADVTAKVGGEYRDAGLGLLSPASYARPHAPADWHLFQIAPTADRVADGVLDRVEAGGYATTCILAQETALAAAIQVAARRRNVVIEPCASLATSGYAAAIAAASPGSVILDASPTAAGEAAWALHQAGWRGAIVGGHDLTATDYSAIARDGARASCVTPWPLPREVPSGDAFASRYLEVSNGLPPGRLAMPAYEATWALLEAIERSTLGGAAPSREGVLDALADTDRAGLLGTITFGDERLWEDAPLHHCEVYAPAGN